MKNMVMVKDDFVDDRILVQHLAEQLVKGRLALVLGAGIAKPFGLPSWKLLVERLYKAKGVPLEKDSPLESSVEAFKSNFYRDNNIGYIKAIHDALYENFDATLKKLRRCLTLASIGSLVMASRRGSISNVITFNFDNLLELYLGYHGFVTDSLSYNKKCLAWASYADIKVYHVHGMIPFQLKHGYDAKIIFDQKSFSEITGQEQDPWRQLVLTLMRQHTCLFIGLSGDDNNLDSILNAVNTSHIVGEDRILYWGVTFSAERVEKSKQWENRGIFYKKINNYDNDLPNFLFSICREAAKA